MSDREDSRANNLKQKGKQDSRWLIKQGWLSQVAAKHTSAAVMVGAGG